MATAAKKRDLTDFPEYARVADNLTYAQQQHDEAEARIRELTDQLAASRENNYAVQAEQVLGGVAVATVSPPVTAEIQDSQRQVEVAKRAIAIGKQREGDARRKASAAICDQLRADYVAKYVQPFAKCLRELRRLTLHDVELRNDLERRNIFHSYLPGARFSGVGHVAGEGCFRVDSWEKDARENYDIDLS